MKTSRLEKEELFALPYEKGKYLLYLPHRTR